MKNLILASSLLLTVAFAGQSKAETVGGICSSGGQTCDANAFYSFESTDESENGRYYIRIQAPSQHCSSVKYYVLLGDGSNSWGSTGWLAPGQTNVVQIGVPLPLGHQVVQIKAVGKRGGCNTGTLGSWKANVTSYWNEE